LKVKLKESDGNLHDSEIWLADGSGGLKSVSALKTVFGGMQTPTALMAKSGFRFGHLGESWDEVELSLEGMTRAMLDHADGIAISLQRTSDGVYFGLNDFKYLDRMTLGDSAGTTLDPTTMTWATVQSYDQGSYWTQRGTSAPRRPYMKFLDFLAAYPGYGPIMIDPKTISASYYSDILDIMDSYGGSSRFVAKYYITGTAWRNAAKARGYLTWGYGYVANMGTTEDWPTLAPGWDWLGLDVGGASSGWTTALSYGKPVIGHIAKSQSDYNLGMSKGASGIMCAALAEIAVV
jgi:hypothetical protein